jgi:hypothetical protein
VDEGERWRRKGLKEERMDEAGKIKGGGGRKEG